MNKFDELIESWKNGNKSYVAAQMKRMKKSEAMTFAVLLVESGERLSVLMNLMEAKP
jgi:hypothetical protein